MGGDWVADIQTGPAVGLLCGLERSGDFVFAGERRAALSNMALLMLLRRMGHADLTAHGFRSTFRDWTADRTHYPREVVEAALAHTIANKVEASYRRSDLFDKRQPLMADWAVFATTHKG